MLPRGALCGHRRRHHRRLHRRRLLAGAVPSPEAQATKALGGGRRTSWTNSRPGTNGKDGGGGGRGGVGRQRRKKVGRRNRAASSGAAAAAAVTASAGGTRRRGRPTADTGTAGMTPTPTGWKAKRHTLAGCRRPRRLPPIGAPTLPIRGTTQAATTEVGRGQQGGGLRARPRFPPTLPPGSPPPFAERSKGRRQRRHPRPCPLRPPPGSGRRRRRPTWRRSWPGRGRWPRLPPPRRRTFPRR